MNFEIIKVISMQVVQSNPVQRTSINPKPRIPASLNIWYTTEQSLFCISDIQLFHKPDIGRFTVSRVLPYRMPGGQGSTVCSKAYLVFDLLFLFKIIKLIFYEIYLFKLSKTYESIQFDKIRFVKSYTSWFNS